MSETTYASPLSGSWSLPDTALGRTHTPPEPRGVRVRRQTGTLPNGRKVYTHIACRLIPAGQTEDGTYWWTLRTVTDEWILPTDTIVYDWLPAGTKLCINPGAE